MFSFYVISTQASQQEYGQNKGAGGCSLKEILFFFCT